MWAPHHTPPMRVLSLALLTIALAVPSAAQSPDSADAVPTIVELLDADGRFTTLLGAIDTADLRTTLSAPGPYTLFAPTDSAFAALPEGALASLSEADLQNVLLMHVVMDAVPASTALATETLPSAWSEHELAVRQDADGVVRVGSAAVVDADWAASNGVVHVIDAVLLPSPPEDERMPEDEMAPDDGM